MNLFLNSPSHYTQEYGAIDEVYAMCEHIARNIDIRKYTEVLDTIGIVPMIAPLEVIHESGWKEIKHVSMTYRLANISLLSDYDIYCNADLIEKKWIILQNILESLKVIKVKLKGKFDYERMEQDIMILVQRQELTY